MENLSERANVALKKSGLSQIMISVQLKVSLSSFRGVLSGIPIKDPDKMNRVTKWITNSENKGEA